MDLEKEREDFEKWRQSVCWPASEGEDDPAATVCAWLAWQARAALPAAPPDEAEIAPVDVAYQIVGALAHYTGTFNHPDVQRALDYLSGEKVEGILPWPREAIVPAAPDGYALVPVSPTDGLLASMALRYDHGVFMPADPRASLLPVSEEARTRRINSIITTMRQLHEEVVGAGFYRPESEADYAARLPTKD